MTAYYHLVKSYSYYKLELNQYKKAYLYLTKSENVYSFGIFDLCSLFMCFNLMTSINLIIKYFFRRNCIECLKEHCDNINVYNVAFIVPTKLNSTRIIRKVLVFHSQVTKENISNLIYEYFNNVQKVLYVDKFSEGLLLKKELS